MPTFVIATLDSRGGALFLSVIVANLMIGVMIWGVSGEGQQVDDNNSLQMENY